MHQSSSDLHRESYDRILRLIQRRVSGRTRIPFEVHLRGGRTYRFGTGEAAVGFTVNSRSGLAALCSFDELRFCEAYMAGSLDVVGDMMKIASFRSVLTDRHPLEYLASRVLPLVIGQAHSNRVAIASHYELEKDFFLTFMDPTRSYSHGVYERDDEALETAQRRKLDFALAACNVEPGDRVLDVGGGWGSFTEHAGRRGIRVTSLTLSHDSQAFLDDLIARLELPCEARYEDFFQHRAPEPYDALVILGVMEHLTDYAAVVRQLGRLVKPGGRIYLDASAAHEKYAKASFISRYIFPGNHSYLCLHKFLTQAEKMRLEVLRVLNDRHSYFLTCKAWAENLDAARDEIVRRWGESLYRTFRLYLWGAAQAFLDHDLEAFRVVLERPRLSPA